MGPKTQAEREALAAQLGLNDAGREILDRLLDRQEELRTLQSKMDGILPVRRQDVITLRTVHGVSQYKIARVLGVSQTTVGNIMRSGENEAPDSTPE